MIALRSMTQASTHLLTLCMFAAIIGIVIPSETQAQRRGGSRGGLLNLLGQDEARQELGLSEEQAQKVEELRARARPGREFFNPFFERLGAAETEEQRTAIRAEMEAAGEQVRTEAEAELKRLLSPEQLKKSAHRLVGERGPWGLTDPIVAEAFGLDPGQAAKLKELQDARQTAMRELGFGTPPERFQAFREQWDAKPLTILTESQRAAYDAAVAGTAKLEGQAAQPAAAPVASSGAENARPTAPTDAASSTGVDRITGAEPAAEATDSDGAVVSFGRSTEETPSTGDRAAETRSLSFNFRYAPWSEVLQLFADYANLTLDLNETPPGTFNYYDSGKYTATEALDILNGYLLQKGYILIRRDDFLVCLNIDDGIPPNLVPNVTADELPKRGRNELLNVIFPIESVSATDVAKEVELLLGPQGKVVPLSTSNSLAVTDIGSNLRRIDRLLATVSAVGPGDLTFKAYPLQHLDPLDAETLVKGQLGVSAGIRNVSSAYDDWRRDRDRDSRDSRDSRSSSAPTAASATTAKVTADDRTNSLLVTATAAQHRIVEQLLKVTDVPATVGDADRVRSGQPYLKVYSLRRSDPQEVVKTLDALMPGVVVNEDGRARKIHIHAPDAVQKEVELLLRQLDGEGVGGDGDSAVTVIPLTTLDPYAAASTIRSLFAGDGDDAPIIEADSFGRRLLIRGSQDQVTQVKTLLAQLGEDGTGRPGAGYSTGPVRTIPLGGRDPEELLPLLQKLWETSGDAPLRVVPSGPGTIIERRPLGRNEPPQEPADVFVPDVSSDPFAKPAANFNILDSVPAAESIPVEDAAPEKTEQGGEPAVDPPQAPPNAEQASGEPPVAVTVQGGNLVLTSEDEEALNRLEELVQRLGQVIPPRTKWTVFYLRTADATETAMLLEQLFPTSSVASTALDSGMFGSLTNGLSSFGGSLMDVAGLDSIGLDAQTLRIIPDIRSNSLFVSGPPDKVAEVEQVLNVLDASDLPDSLRARVPRMIEVHHADVEKVAEIVREVYKDYLQPANAAAIAGNPLAMLLGGGGGGRGDRDRRDEPPGQIRMTVGVDTQTSKLIVSADDALFRQVEELVSSLDQSQLDAKRTVKVVALENANAAMVQQTLGALIPRVRTSSTSDRRNASSNGQTNGNGGQSGSTPSGASPSNGGSSQEEQDRVRRFLEDRMRERMREQGGGGDRGDRGDRGGGDRRSSGRGR